MNLSNRHATAFQLAGVSLFGGLFLPVAIPGLAALSFAGLGAVLVGALVVLVLAGVGLWLLVRSTAAVTVLGATGPRRALWVAVVAGFGTTLWGLGWGVTDESGWAFSHRPWAILLLGGLPFVLVAGTLLRGWRLRGPAVLALLGLVVSGLVVLRQSGPDELALRVRHAGMDRSLVYVVEIPGYRPRDQAYGDRLGRDDFLPADPAAIPPERHIRIAAYRQVRDVVGTCGESALDSPLSNADCEREPDGLVYRRGVVEHGYQVRRGVDIVVVAGSPAVNRGLLRDAARTLRPATAAELAALHQDAPVFMADIPGFRRQPGMTYAPADHTGGLPALRVSLSVRRSSDPLPCVRALCTADGAGLTYVRRDDSHAYALRRGDMNVVVDGGVSVDRELLRRAALDARPATDAELLRALPAPPVTGFVDRLRRWLRTHT